MILWKYFFLIMTTVLTVKALNHWVLKGNSIVSKPDSAFLMRESQNLIGFVKQIRTSEYVDVAYKQLLRQRAQIVNNLQFSMEFGKELVDEAKCAMESLFLAKSITYLNISKDYIDRIGLPNLNKNTKQQLSSNEEPNCEEYTPKMANCLNDTKQAEMLEVISLEPEDEIIFDDVRIEPDVLRRQAIKLLQDEPQSWKSHLISSYYWRNRGNPKNAINCACLAMNLADKGVKDIALLNMGIIFLRLSSLNDAELILSSCVEVAPSGAQAHFALGATLAFKHEFNRSLQHLEEAENLDVRLLPKTVSLRKFMSCLDNLGKKMNKINSYVEYIKNEVRDFKSLKQQIKQNHDVLLHQQVPLSLRQLHETTIYSDFLKRGQYCSTRKDPITNEMVLFCDFYTDIQMLLESKEVDISSLEKQIQISNEAVLKQVSKELRQESFHKTHTLPLLKRTIGDKNEREKNMKTWKS